jgi:tRNA pseudouridine38-40 synthase
MTRWKLILEYDGSGFCGWQKQANALSVQQVLEETLQKFSGEEAALFVAGRTDAGVHAKGQVAHVDLAKETTADIVQSAVNFHVRPHRVAVLSAEAVGEDFHARFKATARTYGYSIINRTAPLALMSSRAWHVQRPLNLKAMNEAAKLLIGKRDFSTFRAANCQAKSPLKTLDVLNVAQDGELFVVTASARSFLYHQVRNMVGTLVMAGTGRWTVKDVSDALTACDRTKGGPTAPPQGLCLESVTY